jgi:hypothetical protein
LEKEDDEGRSPEDDDQCFQKLKFHAPPLKRYYNRYERIFWGNLERARESPHPSPLPGGEREGKGGIAIERKIMI